MLKKLRKKRENQQTSTATNPCQATMLETILMPIPGTIIKIVEPGKSVKKGDILCVFEAMKMENDILSPWDGVVESVWAKVNTAENSGIPLLVIRRAL